MIIAIVGPTGVGKTKLSIALAKKYNAIIINADAMQVYEGMNIGTAKIMASEKEGVSHYLFDIVKPDYNYTVKEYQEDARKIIRDNKDKNIIFVGGSGLYLKACLYDYQFKEENKENDDYSNYSNEELLSMCKKIDSNCNIHINNRKRLVRFLNRGCAPVSDSLELYKSFIVGLTTDRNTLYSKIDKRVDDMFENGLLEEVKLLYQKYGKTTSLMTAIGYKEIIAYLDGNISLSEAKELIKKNSRHYAKRQYTFFNNQLPVNWYDVLYDDFDKTINDVINDIEQYKKETM